MAQVVSEDIDDVQLWLLQDGKEMGTLLDLLKAYVPLVQQRHSSIPIDRMVIVTPNVIHPELGAYLVKYEAKRGYEERRFPKPELAKLQANADNAAPFKQLAMGADFVRIRATDDVISESVRSLFTDGADDGAYTDMYALPVRYRGRVTAYVSWATRHLDGFSDGTLAFFNATQPALGTVLELLSSERTSRNLLCTYLGKDPGSRVYRVRACIGNYWRHSQETSSYDARDLHSHTLLSSLGIGLSWRWCDFAHSNLVFGYARIYDSLQPTGPR